MGSQSVNDEKLVLMRYHLTQKLCSGKPEPVCTYIRRSLSTGIIVLELLDGIEFTELSFSLYFITKDSRMEKLARIYEAELELASISPEKFARNIHKFYNETAVKIKKEGLYHEFFAFLSETNQYCNGIRYGGTNIDNKVNLKVMDAYQSLLLQQLEYLRPDKFNFETRCCGISTTGEVLSCRDTLAYVDSAVEAIEAIACSAISGDSKKSPHQSFSQFLSQEFGRYGYKVHNMAEVEALMECDRVQLAQISMLLPFINEYTYDIVPQQVHSVNCTILDTLVADVDLDEMKKLLKRRRRMLPTNGQIFTVAKISNYEQEYVFFKRFLLRETFYQGKLYLLYKMETTCGEFSGFYEPMSETFYTVMVACNIPNLAPTIGALILFLYASCVLEDGERLWQEHAERLRYSIVSDDEDTRPVDIPLLMERFARGGKPHPSLGDGEAASSGVTKRGSDKYEGEARAVQGYIRKFGEGRKASEEAIARAEALGFSLATDETYVQPHMTTVYIVKKA